MTGSQPPRMSAALAAFLEPLAVREPDVFGDLRAFFPQSAGFSADEQQLRYRLADHAVRVCAAEVLSHEKCLPQSQALRELPTIIDSATAQAAARAVRSVKGLESAALAAQNATIVAADVNDPGFVGEQAAYAVLALADFYVEAGERRQALDDAVDVIKSLAL